MNWPIDQSVMESRNMPNAWDLNSYWFAETLITHHFPTQPESELFRTRDPYKHFFSIFLSPNQVVRPLYGILLLLFFFFCFSVSHLNPTFLNSGRSDCWKGKKKDVSYLQSDVRKRRRNPIRPLRWSIYCSVNDLSATFSLSLSLSLALTYI